ncbi:hypothetical protein Q7P37_003735 [Cladosporium fusiforme]
MQYHARQCRSQSRGLSASSGLSYFAVFIALLLHISACLAQDQSQPLSPDESTAVFTPQYDVSLDKGRYGSYPTKKFYSSESEVPKLNFLKWSPECATRNDFYFITPKGWKVDKPGPMILDHTGELVWAQRFDNEFGGQAYDLMVQEYLGEKFLTFWLGDDRIRGHGAGQFHMINPAYDEIHQIGAANGHSADLHEFLLTPQGTALIIIFEPIKFDVRPAGRDLDDVWNQFMWDCLIQEVNITTKDAIFEWRASEHLNITDSYHRVIDRSDGTPEHPYDPFHFNSVDKDELGNYLISSRYTHAIYYISGTTKEVLWTLGGKSNTFMELSTESALSFAWQHDARFVSPDAFPETYVPPPAKEGITTKLITLFDNAAEDWHYEFGPQSARGLLLELTYPTVNMEAASKSDDTHAKRETNTSPATISVVDAKKISDINGSNPACTARLIQQYSNPETGRASSQGSMQLVPTEAGKDPHVLLGHGINAIISEYSSNGTLLCDAHFAPQSTWEKGDVQSYRALKFSDWVGRPHVPPDVAVVGTNVYVSWNGATGVDEWLLQTLRGGKEDKWRAAGVVKKEGFETRLEIPKDRRRARYLRVTAIDKNGHPLENGVSDPYKRGYIYGHTRQTGQRSSTQTLLAAAACFVVLVLFVRMLRRCYNRLQRRRIAKWRLP